jgi:hypothetical protein
VSRITATGLLIQMPELGRLDAKAAASLHGARHRRGSGVEVRRWSGNRGLWDIAAPGCAALDYATALDLMRAAGRPQRRSEIAALV